MKHASLFSGIGGFDLASQWMGWENVFNCEIDPFCQKILKHHFPTTTQYGDIKELNGTDHTGRVDILTGGFPCQPFSTVGQRRGEEDERHLWPEMLRVIQEIQPTWVVAENVRGLLTMQEGMVFESVCIDLETNGYEIQSFCIPACAIGARHRRDRIWIVANYKSERWIQGKIQSKIITETEHDWRLTLGSIYSDISQSSIDASALGEFDGVSNGLVGISFQKWREESLKAYGNAIVPQVAYQIFQSIENA